MNLKTPINENYAANVVQINNLIPLEGCDNVVHANIFGNLVVVGKETKIGSRGLYFPIETKLSTQYLSENNLYRDNTRNANIDEKGYFEENGRIRCVKFRGFKSQGFFMPLTSLLKFADIKDIACLEIGDTFDEIHGIKICEKYIPRDTRTPGKGGSQQAKKPKVSRVVDGQFRFHTDTGHLGKNIHKITPESILSITSKLHGTSFVVSKVLVKRKLNLLDKALKFFGVKIHETEYDMIYSSRKVIKNDDANKNYNHYYSEDVWKLAAERLKDIIPDGMTVYGEIVGFTPSGEAIQKGYDYSCSGLDDLLNGKFSIYIYRITYTNWAGQVFEFSAKQVQDWCKSQGLNPVPEYFYGKASEIVSTIGMKDQCVAVLTVNEWQQALLAKLQNSYNLEKDCEFCKNKVPAEGIVVVVEGLDPEALKLKSFRFSERETKELDKGVIDIETSESE